MSTVQRALLVLLLLPSTAIAAWSRPVELTTSRSQAAGLAVGARGGVRVLFTDANGLTVARGPAGSALPRRQLLSAHPVTSDVHALTDGRTVVTWTERLDYQAAIPVAATASPGGRFRPFLVGPADARVTTMAVGRTGRALTAFQGTDGIVRVTRWSADGHVGQPQALEHVPATFDLTATIAGRYAIVAWCGGAAGTDVRYATSHDGRPFTAVRSIPGANCGPFLTVAVSPRGNAVAAWKVDMYIDAVSYRRPGHAFAPARLIQAQNTLMGRPFVAADGRGRTSLSWALGFGEETAFLRVNGGRAEHDPCPGGGEVFDSTGHVTSIRVRNYHYDLCTRIGRGRWRTERVPIGTGPIYATAPGVRVLAGSTYEPRTGDSRAIVSFATDRGPRAAPRRPARSRPR